MNDNKHSFPITNSPALSQPSPTETPAFLFKLWKVLEAAEYSKYISWSKNGNSFIIFDQNLFSQVVLPKFFKHSHFTSFVRQLNMYGFRKLTNLTLSYVQPGQEPMEFHHPQFIQGHAEMLGFVKRKSPSSLRIGSRTIKTNDLEKLITDFEQIKFEHDKLQREMHDLKSENSGLRGEIVQLKSKYSRHEQVLTRMMNFIILNALYPERTPSLLPGIKRRRKMIEMNNSHTVAIPEGANQSISLNPAYDDLSQTARTLLGPIDPSNLPYHPYFNMENNFPSQEAERNSLTLYNANYQGIPGAAADDYPFALSNSLPPEKQQELQQHQHQQQQHQHQQQKPSHIRDDVRRAILAKTGASTTDTLQPREENYQMFPTHNNGYPIEFSAPELEQYMAQDPDEQIVDFPDDIALDSSLLSEFLLPNPAMLDPSLLQGFNGMSTNSDLFNHTLHQDTNPNNYHMLHATEEGNEDSRGSLYPASSQRGHL